MWRVRGRVPAIVGALSTTNVLSSFRSLMVRSTLSYTLYAFNFLLRLCFVHNKVNERLGKPIFDCAHLDDEYDCGCGDDGAAPTTSSTPKDEMTGADLIRGGR